MTDEELAAAKALCDAATSGPWVIVGRHDRGDGEPFGIDSIDSMVDCIDPIVKADSGVYGPRGPDAEFIAASRTLVPKLIEEVERLKTEYVELDDAYQNIIESHGKCVVGPFRAALEKADG